MPFRVFSDRDKPRLAWYPPKEWETTIGITAWLQFEHQSERLVIHPPTNPYERSSFFNRLLVDPTSNDLLYTGKDRLVTTMVTRHLRLIGELDSDEFNPSLIQFYFWYDPFSGNCAPRVNCRARGITAMDWCLRDSVIAAGITAPVDAVC